VKRWCFIRKQGPFGGGNWPAGSPLASTASKLLPCASTCPPDYVAAKSRRVGRNIWSAGPMDGRPAHLWRQPTPSRFPPGRSGQGIAGGLFRASTDPKLVHTPSTCHGRDAAAECWPVRGNKVPVGPMVGQPAHFGAHSRSVWGISGCTGLG
jgi:hypothetical protein